MKIPKDRGIQLQVAEQLARHMAASNVLGRLSVANDVRRRTGKRVPLATSTRPKLHFAEGDDPENDAGIDFNLHLPADDAAAYIRGLTPVTRDTFDGLSAQYRKLAFTLAGTADTRLIEKVRDQLAQVVQRGGTPQDYKSAVAKMTTDAGVQEINAFSLDSSFQIATAKAYSLGRYEQQMEPETLAAVPYGQYFTVGDDHVRPAHEALDGFTAKMIDPVWNKIYPPNDFGCRCIRIGALASEVPESADADTPGMHRLPAISQLLIPGKGFENVF